MRSPDWRTLDPILADLPTRLPRRLICDPMPWRCLSLQKIVVVRGLRGHTAAHNCVLWGNLARWVNHNVETQPHRPTRFVRERDGIVRVGIDQTQRERVDVSVMQQVRDRV